ncbi:MAG: peptidase S41 [Bacteroidetes bacterium]|nr:MAG: peptidase S41 [Bacteroidota bacterium]PTM14537.1 MAG: peptidase S41 [Bacteroidota bacterium]
MKFFTTFFALLLLAGSHAQTPPLAHYPALSPDGSQLAFSYQGDIWTVATTGGVARRLTIHQAYESHPQWSPDGQQIAFQGNRYGNDDIFVVSVNGGEARRLTFHSDADTEPQWTADQQVLFNANREFRQIEGEREILRVPASGGTPQRVLNAVGLVPSPSPDGRFIAFVKGNCRFAREAYTGPANRNIFLYDSQTDTYFSIVENDAQDTNPDWDANGNLYYLSATNGRYNVYRQALSANGQAQGAAVALTAFEDEGIRNYDVSADGTTLIFERGSGIFTLSIDGKAAPVQVDIQVSADYRFDPVEQLTQTKGATEMELSPNGKYLLFGVRGDLFVMANDKEKSRAVQLTRHPFRDQDGHWLNDSTVVFTSDRDGNKELYLVESGDAAASNLFKTLKWSVRRLTTTTAEEQDIILSPDRSKIAMVRGRGVLVVADISPKGISNEKVLLDGWATAEGLSWSPDSKWLAYALPDLDFNDEIYIHAADGSQPPVNVSMHPRADSDPFWSADGSKLGFRSIRNNGDADIWFAWLRAADWQKTRQDWEDDESEEEPKKDKDKNGKKEVAPITIDLADIHERLQQVTRLPGNEGDLVISTDGETFFFTTNNGDRAGSPGESALHSIQWDGSDLKTLSEKAELRALAIDDNGKNLYLLKSAGTLAKLKIDGGKLESLAFSAKMTVDHYQERQQIFREGWSSLRDGFYDPQFHGQDWTALRAQYEPLALAASTAQDFRNIFNTMLGQLNASHMGMSGPSPEETQEDKTGRLGVEVVPVAGGVRVTHVVTNGPADRAASKLAEGDLIAAVNGTPLTASTNLNELLNGTVNERTLLLVRNGATEREVVIRPATSLRDELYEEWVAERKRLTEVYSNGRLGYIHIQGMNWPSFERFERELTASGLGKDGIVVDVRYNGGGWTTDMLMAVLNVRQHSYTVPRGAAADLDKENLQFVDHYPYGERLPLAVLTKPAVALCNQNSYSNAEIFSHAFKALGRGSLVGIPTFGAVISTGAQRLLDGSAVRMPFRAWYVKATEENMEHGPAVPDFIVENAPDSKAKGEDEQLRKAVDVLLAEMK